MQNLRVAFLAVLLSTISIGAFAVDHQHEHNSDTHNTHETHEHSLSLKEEIKLEIEHHLMDSHEFHIWKDIAFYLPVIIWNNGLDVFSSSEFYHNPIHLGPHDHAYTAKGTNGNYILYHGKIYSDAGEGLVMGDEHKVLNAKVLDFSITKNVFSILFISTLIFLIFYKTAKNYKSSSVPKGITGFMEPLVLFVRDEIAIPNIGEKKYKKYMSFLLTVFFFIWIVNLFGMTPLGINVTNNIAVTFALAIMTFFIVQFSGNKEYWGHIFWMPGVPVIMKIAFIPIELLGLVIKPFSLMIRLFANMTAGHIVVMSLIGLLYIFNNWFARGAFLGLTLFLSVIELLVAFLQAYIFAMLSALYIGAAVAEHEHEHGHEHH